MARVKLKKNVAVAFFQHLTGHNKSFVQRNLKTGYSGASFEFYAGLMRYHAWILNGRIYCQFFIDSSSTDHAFFNLESFEYDFEETEYRKRKEIDNLVLERLSDK